MYTREQIYEKFPLRVGQIITGPVAETEKGGKHRFVIKRIFRHVFIVKDIESGFLTSFNKIDWYTGAVK